MKKILTLLSIFFVLSFGNANPTFASAPKVVNMPYIAGVFVPGMTRTEFKICEIRRLFCGSMAVAVAGISIFLIGVMILAQKIHWGTAILMIAGIIVFYNAEDIATFFGKTQSWTVGKVSTFVLNPTCSCGCTVELDWLNPTKWFDGTNVCKP
jgi:type IV secretory pathway VirB2 component (pilin)